MASNDVLTESARAVVQRALAPHDVSDTALHQASALLIGPVFFWILNGRNHNALAAHELAQVFLAQLDRIR